MLGNATGLAEATLFSARCVRNCLVQEQAEKLLYIRQNDKLHKANCGALMDEEVVMAQLAAEAA